MKMKTEDVQKLVVEGKLEEALKIAGKFKRTFSISKEDLEIIRTGYECLIRKDFYKQLYNDIDKRIEKAKEVLVKVYGGKEMKERKEKIKLQLNRLFEYCHATTFYQEDLIEILGLESADDKNILLNILEEYANNNIVDKISNNRYYVD